MHIEVMNFDTAIQSVGAQIAVVAAAPIPFAVSLFIVGFGVWKIFQWYYDERLKALEARILFRDEELSKSRDKITLLQVSEKREIVLPIKDQPAQENSDKGDVRRRHALIVMDNALQDAASELAIAGGRFSNRNVPALRAAILTASKLFGIVEPFPVSENQGGPLTLGAGVVLLREILPLLQEGHIDEAIQISRKMHDAEAERSARAKAAIEAELASQASERE